MFFRPLKWNKNRTIRPKSKLIKPEISSSGIICRDTIKKNQNIIQSIIKIESFKWPAHNRVKVFMTNDQYDFEFYDFIDDCFGAKFQIARMNC